MCGDAHTESEWQTRKKRIDTRLKTWGWEVVPFDPASPASQYQKHAVEEYETANGPADSARFQSV
jgi:type I restriction enzyme, R subunit